jgi:hypothetical protein
MPLTESEKALYKETADLLRGSERRMFMARVVKMLGAGGQRLAEKELAWNRGTVRKGQAELERGRPFASKTHRRGRKRIEEYFPNLLEDMRTVIDALNQVDPVFQQTRYYTSVSVSTVRKCLVEWKGYDGDALPSNETLRNRMRKLGYKPLPLGSSSWP